MREELVHLALVIGPGAFMHLGILLHVFTKERFKGHLVADRALFRLRVLATGNLALGLGRLFARVLDAHIGELSQVDTLGSALHTLVQIEAAAAARRYRHYQPLLALVIVIIALPFLGRRGLLQGGFGEVEMMAGQDALPIAVLHWCYAGATLESKFGQCGDMKEKAETETKY